MFEVNGYDIKLTRGDSFYATIALKKGEETYTPDPEDVIRFALKRRMMTPDAGNYVDCQALVTKTIPNDTLLLSIAPADTKSLKFGKYDYDIQITFADGSVDTFIAGGFELMPEVD